MSFFYVGGDNSVTVDVPLGNYKFYYCSGRNWYGIDYKFGDETIYSTSSDTLNFYEDGDSVWGHTIELYMQEDGNFDTHDIDKDNNAAPKWLFKDRDLQLLMFDKRMRFLNNGKIADKITFSCSYYCWRFLPKQMRMISNYFARYVHML